MSYETITFAVSERVATLTVNRPDKLNALNERTIEDLEPAIEEARARHDIGGLIVTGAGRAFIAGADIGELQRHGAQSAKALAERGQEVFRKFETSPKPTIAAVNGFALGGGCELAMACHLRIASEAAKFGQPEVKLGTIPGYGGAQRVPRLLGKRAGPRLLRGGEIRPARGQARNDSRLRRDAAVAAPDRKGPRAATAAERRHDRCPRGVAHRVGQPRRSGRGAVERRDDDAAADSRQWPARGGAVHRRRESRPRCHSRRRAGARSDGLRRTRRQP